MRTLINDMMRLVLDDFKDNLKGLDRFCELKDVRFNGNNTPDYQSVVQQQYYLLRFFPAYLAEYYLIYREILVSGRLGAPMEVLSLGCGCGIDYYALYLAARDLHLTLEDVFGYTGVDVAPWRYQHNYGSPPAKFSKLDAERLYLNGCSNNVFVFPKSIGEIAPDDFGTIENVFRHGSFDADQLCLVASLRNRDCATETHRVDRLVHVLETQHNYQCLDVFEGVQHLGAPQFADLCEGFCYPQNARDFITSLRRRCPRFRSGKCAGTPECTDLDRQPILYTSYSHYIIRYLQRQD